MNKLIIIMGLVFALIALAIPVSSWGWEGPVFCDDLEECEFRGAYVECTGVFTCDAFLNVPDGASLYIHDATITVTGDAGVGGSDGYPGIFYLGSYILPPYSIPLPLVNIDRVKLVNVNIIGTGGEGGYSALGGDVGLKVDSDKLYMENVSITSVAGTGGDGTPDAKAGGKAIIHLISDDIYLSNVSIDLTAGTGGEGNAATKRYCDGDNDCWCEGEHTGEGGNGGDVEVNISSTDFEFYNVEFLITDAEGGIGDVAACAAAYDGYMDGDGADVNGADASMNSIVVETTTSYVENFTFTITMADGKDGKADTNIHDNGGEDECETAAAIASGGLASIVVFDWDSTNDTLINFTFTALGQDNGDSAAEVDVVCDGTGEDYEDDSENGKDGADSTFDMLTDYLVFNKSSISIKGTKGGIAYSASDESSGYADCKRESAEGGDAGAVIFSIEAIESSIFYDNLIAIDGNDGEEARSTMTTECAYHLTDRGGYGGDVTITVTGINNIDTSYTTNTGNGADSGQWAAPEKGLGGRGGNYIFNSYETTIFNGSNITVITGYGGDGGIRATSGTEGGGNGGDITFKSYNSTILDFSIFDFTGGNSGDSNGGTDYGFGGDVIVYNYDSLYLYNFSEIEFNGGESSDDGGSGGITYIDSDVILFMKSQSDIDQNPGIGNDGRANGTCQSVMQGIFSIENSTFDCDTTNAVASVVGSNMTQVDYRVNSTLDLTGNTATLTFSYIGDPQKFLMWDSTFDATTINWDCAVAEFANITPASTGSITFNSSCADNVTREEYYTTFNYVNQIWNASGTLKPLPYSYPDYYCTINVSYTDDVVGPLYANITWYNDSGVTAYTETGVNLTALGSGVEYTSTAFVGGGNISIGDNWTCNTTIYSDFSEVNVNTTQVVAAYHYDLQIDVGNNSNVDYDGSGQFIGTHIINFTNAAGLNDYIRNCETDYCLIPIRFYSNESGKLTFNNVTVQNGLTNAANGTFNLSIAVFSEEPGTVVMSDIEFKYPYGDGQVYVMTAEGQTSGDSDTHNITVVQSNFSQYLPTNILYWEMYPRYITSQNVEPYGQKVGTPIFTIYNNHSSENVDIYMKLNHSWATMSLPCTELEFVQNYTPGAGININTTGQLYCDNITNGSSCTLWAFEDFSCTWAQVEHSVYNPEFIWDAMCEDCVLTYDFND